MVFLRLYFYSTDFFKMDDLLNLRCITLYVSSYYLKIVDVLFYCGCFMMICKLEF